MAGHRVEEVQSHYAALANNYDAKANRACKCAYETLIQRSFPANSRVLEIGAGSSPLLDATGAALGVACDLSLPMLAARRAVPEAPRVVANGQRLPFCDGSFDGVFCVNVLEHAPDPAALVTEAARVLAPGGKFLAITPNGDVEWLLDLLERFRLKLPEGPHRFLTWAELEALVGHEFSLVEQRRFLAFPAGSALLDRLLTGAGQPEKGRGLFQYVIFVRRDR